MVGNRLAGSSALISLPSGPSNKGTEGTWLLIRLSLPIETITLPLRANKLLRILKQLVAVRVALIVLALRVHKRQTDLDNVQLIATDAPVDYFLFAFLSIEPPAIGFLDKRNRKRPLILSHLQDHLRFTRLHQLVCLVIRFHKAFTTLVIGDWVAAFNNGFCIGTENF